MNRIPDIKEASVISSFCANVREPRMREKLRLSLIETTHELWRLADKCACAEEGRMPPDEPLAGEDAPTKRTRKRGSRSAKKVLAAEPEPKNFTSSVSAG